MDTKIPLKCLMQRTVHRVVLREGRKRWLGGCESASRIPSTAEEWVRTSSESICCGSLIERPDRGGLLSSIVFRLPSRLFLVVSPYGSPGGEYESWPIFGFPV